MTEQKRYFLIAEDELRKVCEVLRDEGCGAYSKILSQTVRSRPFQSGREKLLERAIQLQKDVEMAFNKKTGEYNPTSIMIVQQYVKELRQGEQR